MQRIIIIGATSGIGRALAKFYAEVGNRIGIVGRRVELLESLRAEQPDKFVSQQLDVTEIASVEDKLNKLADELGGLDLLIISSGTGELNPTLDFVVERPTLETNVLGFTAVADWAYRYFEKQGAGHLVGITSIAALLGEAEAPAYSATKAFQVNYLEALRNRAKKGGRKIVVTEIRPGFVDTDMAKGDGKFWVAPVEKAAKQIARAIQKRRKIAYITKRWQLIGLVLRLLKVFG